MSAWNDFVKKIFNEGRAKDKNYQFKHALKDASARKSEMNASFSKKNAKMQHKKTSKKGRKSRRCKCPKKRTNKRRND